MTQHQWTSDLKTSKIITFVDGFFDELLNYDENLQCYLKPF